MTGEELKEIRLKLKLSIRRLSERIGVSHTLINAWEKENKRINDDYVKQIKEVLGLNLAQEKPNLKVGVDYLKLTFFNSNYLVIMSQVIGVDPKFFQTEERRKHNYELWHQCGSIVLMSSSNDKKETLLDLTSEGIGEFEALLNRQGQTLMSWLKKVLDPAYYLSNGFYTRIHSTRLDLAIDEMYDKVRGNFDLHVLKVKKAQGLVKTDASKYQVVETRKGEDSNGLTLYFGARGNDGIFIRFYEKRYEQASKLGVTVEDVLENDGVWNRYEIELGKNNNPYVLERYLAGDDLVDIAVNLLLSKIEVYDQDPETDELIFHQPFYDVFGQWKKVDLTIERERTSLRQSIIWVEKQVFGTLKLLSEVVGKDVVMSWIEVGIDEAKLTPMQQKRVEVERVLLDHETLLLDYFGSDEKAGGVIV